MNKQNKQNNKNDSVNDSTDNKMNDDTQEVVEGVDAIENSDANVENSSDQDNGKSEDEAVELIDAPKTETLEVETTQADVKPVETVVKKGAGFGTIIIAALLGGLASLALLAGGGYYAIKSNNLGVISNLLNGSSGQSDANESRYTDISTRVLALEGDIANATNQTENVLPAVDLTPVTERIVTLEAELSAVKKVLEATANVSISGEVDVKTIAAMQSEITELKTKSEVNVNTSSFEQVDIAPLVSQNEAQEVAIATLDGKLSDMATQIEALKQSVKTASENQTASIGSEEATNMASALAVASLERALQDEAPFEVELNAIKGFAGENTALAELASFSKTGLVGEVSLLSQFEGLLETALVADLKGEGTTVLDKFIGNAKSIISIRRTGNVKGAGTEAVLARMEMAIKAKDLKSAITEAEQLDGPAKAVFENWLSAVKARLAAQDLMRQVSAEILGALSK